MNLLLCLLGTLLSLTGALLWRKSRLLRARVREQAHLVPVVAQVEGPIVLESFRALRDGREVEQTGPRYTLAFTFQGKTYRSERREGYLRPEYAEKAKERLASERKILYINPQNPKEVVEERVKIELPAILGVTGVGVGVLGLAVLFGGLFLR